MKWELWAVGVGGPIEADIHDFATALMLFNICFLFIQIALKRVSEQSPCNNTSNQVLGF